VGNKPPRLCKFVSHEPIRNDFFVLVEALLHAGVTAVSPVDGMITSSPEGHTGRSSLPLCVSLHLCKSVSTASDLQAAT
jgi:hypothetical protein